MKNTVPYFLAFKNDYNSVFMLVMEVDFDKMPWDIGDGYESLVDYAYERAAETSVLLGDYTLVSISYGGMTIASFS